MKSSTRHSLASCLGAPVLAAGSLVALLMAAGCASTQLDAQWVDPQLPASTLRGARVLVVCEAYEAVVKRLCQDQLAAEVVARGATPVIGPEIANPSPGRALPDDTYLPAARAAGARAVLATTVSLASSDVSPGFSVGLGGFGFGSHSGVGVGVSAPIGGGQVTPGYAANSRLMDVASGRLMWTAKATAPPSGDLNLQLSQLAKTVLGSAEKAGLF